MGVRFEEAKQKAIVLPFPFCIVNCRIGNGKAANTFLEVDGRPVPCEVVEATRFGEPPQFHSPQSRLQVVQEQTPHVVDIYPGSKDGQDIRLIALRNRVT
jgi:hypothetical protein